MKKVLLVGSNSLRAPYPVTPVGLCLVAAALEPDWQVRVFDPNADGADLAAVVGQFAPDYVGLGIRNIDDVVMEDGVSFVNDVRERFARPLRTLTRAPLILGGAGFSIFPQEWLEECDADYGVVGEGEAAFPALLAALERGRDPLAVPGVVSRGRSAAPRAARPVLLDLLPFAEIDQRIDYAPYRERGAYPIQTKRGCARRCVYCSYPQIEGRAFRCRPAESVVDEIQQVSERLGDVAFEFVDSVFNDPPGHAESICWEIAQRGLKVRLRTMGVNPAQVTRELIDLMSAAGFAQIDSTPDSASPAMLEEPAQELHARAAAAHRDHRARGEDADDVVLPARRPGRDRGDDHRDLRLHRPLRGPRGHGPRQRGAADLPAHRAVRHGRPGGLRGAGRVAADAALLRLARNSAGTGCWRSSAARSPRGRTASGRPSPRRRPRCSRRRRGSGGSRGSRSRCSGHCCACAGSGFEASTAVRAKGVGMILTNVESVPGRVIAEHFGLVSGSTVRSKHFGKDFMAGLKNIVGGELKGYTELLEESRREAVNRMVEMAKGMGANAVVNIRFSTSSVAAGAAELYAYGTAVRLE